MTCDDFTISSHFTNIDDPRKYNIRHNFIDIITIAICALICGAGNRVNVEQVRQIKK
ncbi:MAG: transposase family protein [Deltaproteobacteria bacterium]|nr:transposase family protein [Deltaproteobacteria bacterium]